MMGLPKSVKVVEVGIRDGLQNESVTLGLDDKQQLIEALVAAGIRDIEVGAFVRADRVPQMADSDRLFQQLPKQIGVRYWMLVPNEKGLQRAIDCGVTHIALFTAASDMFAQANIGMTVAQSLSLYDRLITNATKAGMTVRGYVSTAWWCPYAGRVERKQTLDVVQTLLGLGCEEVSIADTIGAATPGEVFDLLSSIAASSGTNKIAVHFHDTRGTALANTLAALQVGIQSIDSAAGGAGGCPFAPGATGNLATEDLLYLLQGLGITTGIDLDAVFAVGKQLETLIGRPLPSRYLHAGPVVTARDVAKRPA